MSTGVKNANEILSRIVEDLSAKALKGEDISSTLLRLRDEIQNASENEDTVYAKFLRLLESLRQIIPQEHLRYQAAVLALSKTEKLDQQEIVRAIGYNLGELKANIAKLRETLGRLESGEREIRSAMTAPEKQTGVAGTEAGDVKKKVGQSAPAAPAPQPVQPAAAPPAAAALIDIFPDRIEHPVADQKAVAGPLPQPLPPAQAPPARAVAPADIFPGRGEKKIIEQKAEVPAPMPPPAEASKQTKKCSMCGGQMIMRAGDKMWMCTGCGYAEAGMIEIENKQIIGGVIEGGLKSAPLPAPSSPDAAWQHRCPMCGGQMNFHGQEKIWLCYTCAHEESSPGETRGPGKAASVRAEAPAAPTGWTEPIKGTLGEPARPKTRQASKKKPCPACRKKMAWHEEERAWRCPFCEYERRI